MLQPWSQLQFLFQYLSLDLPCPCPRHGASAVGGCLSPAIYRQSDLLHAQSLHGSSAARYMEHTGYLAGYQTPLRQSPAPAFSMTLPIFLFCFYTKHSLSIILLSPDQGFPGPVFQSQAQTHSQGQEQRGKKMTLALKGPSHGQRCSWPL